MHALHLPPRHLWRTALLALLLTIAIMAAGIGLSGIELGSTGGGGGEATATGTGSAVVDTSGVDREGARWATSPLTPPAIAR
jgi:hypothetical protein